MGLLLFCMMEWQYSILIRHLAYVRTRRGHGTGDVSADTVSRPEPLSLVIGGSN
jgi:hypothetical protein